MELKAVSTTIEMANGKSIKIESGKLARQADGSVVVSQGNTMLLATVVSAEDVKPGIDFFPLTVEYQEKFASAGRIPGSFQRREGRPSDYEILICRIVDRAIRPLFNKDYKCETQVLVYLISLDPEVLPDALAGLAASAALTISNIPFEGPISEVRVALINGNYVVNPTATELKDAKLDILLAASADEILMVEGEAKECSEAELTEAIRAGHEVIKLHCAAQLHLRELCGKPKREIPVAEVDLELKQKIADFCSARILDIASASLGKAERKAGFKAIKEDFLAGYSEEELAIFNYPLFYAYYGKLEKEIVRNMMIDQQKRLDGRKFDEIRPIFIETDFLPSPHGSALFTRGETQSLTTVTLGSKDDEQLIDKAQAVEFKKFLLHYNFPPFSTGEAKPMRGTSRREVGHGNLALRSLKMMLPEDTENPYTIRVVSDILESNGSSSMATVCAGSLALMDAGVKFKKHVSGIAMGLVMREDAKYAILSDILGDEDHLGDMDFKVTGTKDGICGVQMDLKVQGLSYELLMEALEQARRGRLHILDKMELAISAPREEMKPQVPRVVSIDIPKDFIGAVIGPGGSVIRDIQEKTNTVVNLEEIKELGIGRVVIMSPTKDNLDAALNRIKGIVAVPEVGDVYTAKVVSLMPYGAFVEFLPGKQGLLHISEIEHRRLDSLEGVLTEGQEIEVKLLDVDKKTGKFKLSRKVLLPKD